ncbi:hypothetical protein AYO44_05345 [Planctomycetaceae bacterium SCGC AG-212-F19]|nr:hypothetical protein AYO44_05345 [Planctomycetaceae bacterium SCGC AG-212-F19]
MHNAQSLHDASWQHTADRSRLYADPTTPARKQKLRRAVAALPPGARVLDFGCGRGEFTEWLASLGLQAVGVDLSGEAIRLNRLDFPGLEFLEIAPDGPTLFPAGHFDAIWSSEVIEHVYDVHGLFAEFARLLRPDGRLIVTTPYHGWLKNLLLVTFAFERHFNVEWQHIRFWTRRSLTQVAAAHRFRPLVWDTIGRVRWLAKSFFVVFERLPS